MGIITGKTTTLLKSQSRHLLAQLKRHKNSLLHYNYSSVFL